MEGQGGEDGRIAGDGEKDGADSRYTRAHAPRYARVCVCVVNVRVWVLAGIRHPINLLLANRLANCERMLARANKGASIY